jgi:hypothetical protein
MFNIGDLVIVKEDPDFYKNIGLIIGEEIKKTLFILYKIKWFNKNLDCLTTYKFMPDFMLEKVSVQQ